MTKKRILIAKARRVKIEGIHKPRVQEMWTDIAGEAEWQRKSRRREDWRLNQESWIELVLTTRTREFIARMRTRKDPGGWIDVVE